MKFKQGFTLAEILIVLMVIGIISTMTVPSLMGGVTQQQYKTAFKKAYSQVANIMAMDKASDTLPTTGGADAQGRVFSSLNGNLSIKSFCTSTNCPGSASDSTLRPARNYTVGQPQNSQADGTWLNTEDGMSYLVLATGATTACSKKAEIMKLEANVPTTATTQVCAVVVVDVNGLAKGPNLVEPQQANIIASDVNMDALTGDRFYIFVGTDGATAGSEVYTVGGRIVTDAK